MMGSTDAHGLGYHDVDGDPHTLVLVANMEATAAWRATRRLRAWERRQLAIGDGERVLDVGCGRGEAAISLGADLGPTGELVGIDASAAMWGDADVVRLLRRAGAIVWAKTNVPYYAGDHQTYNDVYGVTNNPWDLTRTSGGSSGGAAVAVACGFTTGEIGSDIGSMMRK